MVPRGIRAWPVVCLAGGVLAVGSTRAGSEPGKTSESRVTTRAAQPRRYRRVAANETWEIRDGRFHRNGRWVFLKTAKLLRNFADPRVGAATIGEIDLLIDRHHYSNFSLNIYPDVFDRDADGEVDAERAEAVRQIGRILDHLWRRGVFGSLSLETYNVGGGGVPAALFEKCPGVQARNALLEPAADIEYAGELAPGAGFKPIPSIHHPIYVRWAHTFIRDFLRRLGRVRIRRLLYVETTVEPQYLGRNNQSKDQRKAHLDHSEAASKAFGAWRRALPADHPKRKVRWPGSQEERDATIGNADWNVFRAEMLARWVNKDAAIVRTAAPGVFAAVDYNARRDDPKDFRLGDRDTFLSKLEGVDIIQIAPHHVGAWGADCWLEVRRVNERHGKGWAISEHMTAMGHFPEDDNSMRAILAETLKPDRGTRFGWDFVNVVNTRHFDRFALYHKDWTSPVLDVCDNGRWFEWLERIGAQPFRPQPRP